MYFQSVSDALQMAGHGPYVWAAYSLTTLVVAALLLTPLRRGRELRRQITAEMKRQSPPREEVSDASQT
jgi:heme exporter protein D